MLSQKQTINRKKGGLASLPSEESAGVERGSIGRGRPGKVPFLRFPRYAGAAGITFWAGPPRQAKSDKTLPRGEELMVEIHSSR
jgi:hypothetical protein